ncbi:hypothetical protein [Rhodococcus sp. T7]|uniref:hypothetical protein n=1 Tax=Rhodococcus sp. T7 TaxID=627444 RepID=UPI001F44145F|nr:hypothetical protein [Rhodococcus sp. T7]
MEHRTLGAAQAAIGGTAENGLNGGCTTYSAGEEKEQQGDIEVHGEDPFLRVQRIQWWVRIAMW